MVLLVFASLFVPLAGAISVSAPILRAPTEIVISPSSATIEVNDSQQFTATARFGGAAPDLDVTNDALTTWSSGNGLLLTINTTGLASAISSGDTTVSATYGGVMGQASVHVDPAAVVVPPVPPPSSGGGAGSVVGGGGGGASTPSSSSSSVSPATLPAGTTTTSPTTTPTTTTTPTPVLPSSSGRSASTLIVPASLQSGGGLPSSIPPIPSPPPPGEEEFAFIPSLMDPGPFDVRVLPSFLPDELSVTRGEIMVYMVEEFDLDESYVDLIELCYENFEDCMSIFLIYSNFDDVILDTEGGPLGGSGGTDLFGFINQKLLGRSKAASLFDFGTTQLFPDVDPRNPYSYAINVGTIISVVHGYYSEETSPFKPYSIIRRVEAVKVILGSVGLMDWLYYDELEALLGGEEGIEAQQTPFADVTPTRDYMWWYPRYLELGCEVDMYDCVPGSNFRPDEYVTEAEIQDMIDRLLAYLRGDGADAYADRTGDDDGDDILNYMERNIYFTDSGTRDTDRDKLNDRVEVGVYLTSPFLADSDWEGLTDYDEVITYNTNPLDEDTDDDLFTDFSEIVAGTDPLDSRDFPRDDDGDGVWDVWEEDFQIDVKDGIQDTDGEGLSDRFEYMYGTDPTNVDTDGDGFTDAEEVLEYRTNPLDLDDPGSLDKLGVRITNFQENQLVGDTTPLIRGVAPLGAEVRLLLRNDYGHELVLGSTTVDENNVFIFQVLDPIRDGRYMIVARALEKDKKRVTESDPVHIIIDSTLNVALPIPKRLADVSISENMLLRNLKVEIRDNRPVLIGNTEYGNKVSATWRSLVTTSILIADTTSGEFEIMAPRDLELGDHEVYVTATRQRDNAQSETVSVPFTVLLSDDEGLLRGAGELGGAMLSGAFPFGVWVIIFLAVGLGIAGVYWWYYARGERWVKKNGAKGKLKNGNGVRNGVKKKSSGK